MKEVLLALVQHLNSSVFILIGILAVCFCVLYKLGKWTEKFKAHDCKIDEAGKNTERLIRLETKMDLVYMNTAKNPLVQSHSPISLTKLGEDVSSNIKAAEILKNHYVQLKKIMEHAQPKTAYDIQEQAMRIARESLDDLLNEDELVTVKDEAFKHGVPLEDVLVVIGILLRNEYLREKGIPISEIDKTKK
jgi:uncharacterized protein YajQ (UPF0234 family)